MITFLYIKSLKGKTKKENQEAQKTCIRYQITDESLRFGSSFSLRSVLKEETIIISRDWIHKQACRLIKTGV